MMWLSGSIKSIHEKFVSHLIKRKCIVEIDKQEITRKETFLIYLPEGETNELSLLFLHFLIKSCGFNVINAGTDVSLYDLIEVLDIRQPDFLYTIINDSYEGGNFQNYIGKLCSEFSESKIILSGLQVQSTLLDESYVDQIVFLGSSEETLNYLSNL